MESVRHEPWNKGKLIGQKPPLKPQWHYLKPNTFWINKIEMG
jgi:hypothetical protein